MDSGHQFYLRENELKSDTQGLKMFITVFVESESVAGNGILGKMSNLRTQINGDKLALRIEETANELSHDGYKIVSITEVNSSVGWWPTHTSGVIIMAEK